MTFAQANGLLIFTCNLYVGEIKLTQHVSQML